MNIFISWSGDGSKKIAAALKGWLPDVFQGVEIFMSAHDIEAGTRWGSKLNNELEESNYGILCLTQENLSAPWLLFEAGALSKSIKEGKVVPYLFGVKPTDVGGPLSQFQGVLANEEGTLSLVKSINSLRQSQLNDEQLKKTFNKWWPDLTQHLNGIKLKESNSIQRSDRELLEEILQRIRTRAISASESIHLAWTPSKTIHNVTIEDLQNMSPRQLYLYIDQCRSRFNETSSRGEEDVLEGRISHAESELKRRNLPTN